MTRSYQRILIFQTAFLGDAILAIPLLKGVRELFPQARISFVCRLGLSEFFLKTALADEVVEVDKKKAESLTKAFEHTKVFHPDLVISPHQSFRTALWVWRLKPAMSVGFKSFWTRFAYKISVNHDEAKHDVLRQLSLLAPFGMKKKDAGPDQISLAVSLPSENKFSDAEGAVALAPGSQWKTKMWSKEGYVEVARALSRQNSKVVLVGTPAEENLCGEIEKAVPGVMNLCGRTTILELAQLLKRCRLLIGNDSGTMHVASAAGTPLVSIFGPTVPAQGYAPWSTSNRVVEVELPCRPCGAHGHDKCPLGTHDCMKKIEPAQVLRAAGELLS